MQGRGKRNAVSEGRSVADSRPPDNGAVRASESWTAAGKEVGAGRGSDMGHGMLASKRAGCDSQRHAEL